MVYNGQLDDLDFTDELALLSHNQNKMQNTPVIETTAVKAKANTKVLKINSKTNSPVTLQGDVLYDLTRLQS